VFAQDHPHPPSSSREDVLTVEAASVRLGLPLRDGKAWLEDEGLVVCVAGRERVLWGQVLDRLDPEPESVERPWSESDLLTIKETLDRLSMNHQRARQWLHRNGLVRRVGQARRVVWGDVLKAVRGDDERAWDEDVRPRVRRRLPMSARL
jgi:hypothetical protein